MSFAREKALQILRDIHIEAAGRSADKDWFEAAMRGVRVLAKRQQYLSSDDVWNWIRPLGIKTTDSRAMGAVMRNCFRDRHIEPTREFTPSERPACHKRPIRIWKSLTYESDE